MIFCQKNILEHSMKFHGDYLKRCILTYRIRQILLLTSLIFEKKYLLSQKDFFPQLHLGWKEINLPNICFFPMDIRLLPPDGTTLTDIRTENTDVREVGFHPPLHLLHNRQGFANVTGNPRKSFTKLLPCQRRFWPVRRFWRQTLSFRRRR